MGRVTSHALSGVNEGEKVMRKVTFADRRKKLAIKGRGKESE